jgi:hypothetical protein
VHNRVQGTIARRAPFLLACSMSDAWGLRRTRTGYRGTLRTILKGKQRDRPGPGDSHSASRCANMCHYRCYLRDGSGQIYDSRCVDCDSDTEVIQVMYGVLQNNKPRCSSLEVWDRARLVGCTSSFDLDCLQQLRPVVLHVRYTVRSDFSRHGSTWTILAESPK